MRLAGKSGVVTGTSRGLGREILLAAAAEGARVVAVARNAEAGEAAVEEARAAGGDAVFRQGDVRNEQDVVAAIERCVAEYGGARLPRQQRRHSRRGTAARDDERALGRPRRDASDRHVLGLQARDRRHARERSRRRDRQHRLDPLLHRRRLPRGVHGDEVGRARTDEGDRDRLRARRHPLQLRLPRRHGDADDRAVLRRDGGRGRGRGGDGGGLPGQADRPPARGRDGGRSTCSPTRRRS